MCNCSKAHGMARVSSDITGNTSRPKKNVAACGERVIQMTDRTPIERGQRVLVWATVREPSQPSGMWWIQLDGHTGSIAVHQDAMVTPQGASAAAKEGDE